MDALQQRGINRRVLDQIAACGTAVGANLFEADEALSRADFAKCVGISVKELNELRFWLRLSARRAWMPSDTLATLLDEADQLKRILGTILHRTRNPSPAAP